jgi:guanylate kinase
VKRRFEAAKVEIEHYGFFDYLVVNDDVESAFKHLEGIVLAERSRRFRRADLAERLLRAGKL